MPSLPIIDYKNGNLENLNSLFDEYGFVRLDNVFTGEEIDELHSTMNAILNQMNPEEHPKVIFTSDDKPKNAKDTYFLDSFDKIRFFYEDQAFDENGQLIVPKERAINKCGHALHWLNPTFKKYTFHESAKKIAKQLGIKEPHIVQSMFIFKQPKIGDEVCAHVDSTYLRVEPTNPSKNLLGVWIPIEEANIENGCLSFIPGSHKWNHNLNYQWVRNISGNPTEPLCKFVGERPDFYDSDKYIPCPVPKGSIVLISGLVVHKSEKNKSNISRHAYTYHIGDFYKAMWSPLNWPQETSTYKFPNLYEVEA